MKSLEGTPPVTPDLAEALHPTVEARPRLADQRYSEGQRALVTTVASAPHPMSIAESGAAPPDLPRSTAYRILVDRERAGVVRRSNAGDEIARFELDDELIGQHHRLICVRCGSVLDASASATLEQTLDNSVRQLALAQSFVPHDYQPDVLGVCAPCALADPPVPVHQK